jgi:hypothetical protein
VFLSRRRIAGWAAAVVLAALAVWVWPRIRPATAEAVLGRLPDAEAPVLYLDVASLRQWGLLERIAGEAGVEEQDYRDFVAATGFNYRRDLDAVAIWFGAEERRIAASGRFDEGRLARYAQTQGGQCVQNVCSVEGSSRERQVSFAVKGGLLEMAVAARPFAVANFQKRQGVRKPAAARSPVWLYLPAGSLRSNGQLGLISREVVAALEGAAWAVFQVDRDRKLAVVRMDAEARDSDGAQAMAQRFQKTTASLQRIPGLPGLLKQGQFVAKGQRLEGRWPLEFE